MSEYCVAFGVFILVVCIVLGLALWTQYKSQKSDNPEDWKCE